MAAPLTDHEELAANIVGSNVFGRDPKINNQQTYNMIISDNMLISAPGYANVLQSGNNQSHGRCVFPSQQGGFQIKVVDNIVFKVTGTQNNLQQQALFALNTFTGNVFCAENLNDEIGIVDGESMWVYNFGLGTHTQVNLPLNPYGNPTRPGMITYHDTYLIIADTTSNTWLLSDHNNATNFFWGPSSRPVSSAIQTKPDNMVAVIRAPGKGNLIYVIGQTVIEPWYDNGLQLFPYQRSNAVSIDYGCLSAGTIAAMDRYVAFLGINEQSGPVLMISEGSTFTPISTDGIDLMLARLVNPKKSTAFFYQIDGHVLYQITFYDPADNQTHIYDFKTKKFFYFTDQNFNFHPAQSISYFNGTNYFCSLNDGNLYELNSKYTTFQYADPKALGTSDEYVIPRVRFGNTFRKNNTKPFIADDLTFLIEQGVDSSFQSLDLQFLTTEDGSVLTTEPQQGYIGSAISNQFVTNNYEPRVDLAISSDSGETFGSFRTIKMNPLAKRQNIMPFRKLGITNDFTYQLRFWAKSDITVGDGILGIRSNS